MPTRANTRSPTDRRMRKPTAFWITMSADFGRFLPATFSAALVPTETPALASTSAELEPTRVSSTAVRMRSSVTS